MSLQTWRWNELLQILKVATTGSRNLVEAVKRLLKFATASLIVFRWQHFQVVCRATFSSSLALGFGWSL